MTPVTHVSGEKKLKGERLLSGGEEERGGKGREKGAPLNSRAHRARRKEGTLH